MSERKKVPMGKDMTADDIAGLNYVHQKIGQYQAFEFMGQLGQIQIAQILRDLHEDGKYKRLGYRSWDELCGDFGLSRQTGYRLKDNYEAAGPAVMELMIKSGLSIRDQHALLAASEIEDVEFEVLDQEKGEVKIRGKVMLVQDAPDLVSAAISRALNNLRLERHAKKGMEQELSEKKAETKRLREKISTGEKEFARLQKQLRGPAPKDPNEVTRLSVMLTELINFTKQICAEEMTEDDEAARGRWMTVIERQVIGRLVAKFNPRGEDLEDWAGNMAGQNEYADEAGIGLVEERDSKEGQQ